MTLPEFLLARLDEDEAWANACEGLHWEWRGNTLDDLVTPDPLLDDYIDGESVCSLRSVEQFPYSSIPGEGPRFLIHSAEETVATAAGHIVRHDPARVLAEVAAKRAIVALHPLDPIKIHSWGTTGGGCNLCDHDCNSGGDTSSSDPCDTLRALATPYAEHPDYDESWRP